MPSILQAAHALLCARIGASQMPERFGGAISDRTCLPRKVLEKDGLVLGPHDGHGAPPPPSFTKEKDGSTAAAAKDEAGGRQPPSSLTTGSSKSVATASAIGADHRHEPTGGELESSDSFGVFNGTASLPEPSFGVFGTGQGAYNNNNNSSGENNRGGGDSSTGSSSSQSFLGPLEVPDLARGSDYALAEAMEDRVEVCMLVYTLLHSTHPFVHALLTHAIRPLAHKISLPPWYISMQPCCIPPQVRPGAKHEVMLDVVCEPDTTISSSTGSRGSEHSVGGGQTVVVSWSFALVSYLATSDISFGVAFQPAASDSESAASRNSNSSSSNSSRSTAPPVEDVWIGEKPDNSSSSASGVNASFSDPGREIVTEQKRMPADPSTPVKGEFATSRSGTLVLTWDNTYSLFMAKDVRLRVEVWGKASLNGAGGSGGDGGSGGGGGGSSGGGGVAATIKPSLGAKPPPTTSSGASADTAASMSERFAQNMASLPSVALPLPTSPVASVPTFFSWKGSDGIGGLGSSTMNGPADAERAASSGANGATATGANAASSSKEGGFWGAPTDFAVPEFLRPNPDSSDGSAPQTPKDGNRPPSPTLWERMTSPNSGKS